MIGRIQHFTLNLHSHKSYAYMCLLAPLPPPIHPPSIGRGPKALRKRRVSAGRGDDWLGATTPGRHRAGTTSGAAGAAQQLPMGTAADPLLEQAHQCGTQSNRKNIIREYLTHQQPPAVGKVMEKEERRIKNEYMNE